ncbi:MAG: tRNA (guanosine(37)-N1)-methyltransferase TrmD [Candidatus Alcyoniella australis]|nr:tRNA (guanosine(37)-N1)-methyltransferase TrmD [Candidatus Alcyoniella australis]
MRIDVLTIFPEMFDGFLREGIIRRAQQSGILDIRIHDLRAYTVDRHRTTDDYPFGGGPGMVMKVEPIARALRKIRGRRKGLSTALLSAQGRTLDQNLARELSAQRGLVLICGRYEGVDERVAEGYCDFELSIGDYVLTGGEPAAMVVIDAVGRLVPGVLGNAESLATESFPEQLEYQQYTRPRIYAGRGVPEVLLSGDHRRIAAWRREQSRLRTAKRRPDLLHETKK